MALVVVAIIMVSLYAYTGMWPPLVVVESDSMQHSSDRSYIGVIDAGDLVLDKETNPDTIITYLQGQPTGYQTYGEYGDVIIYERYGNPNYKSIIHRVICRVEYNSSGGGFDIPELADIPQSQWQVLAPGEQTWWNLRGTVEIYDIGYEGATIQLDLEAILTYFESRGRTPHSGFITMGDHNTAHQGSKVVGLYDQMAICREPIQDSWVIGVARGELPWFGLLKLWVSGDAPENVPQNSWTNLWISLGLIIGVPLALDIATLLLKRRGIDIWAWTKKLNPMGLFQRNKGSVDGGGDPPEDKGPRVDDKKD